MLTVAVTGATGFIAHHLVARLVENGHTVRALTRGQKPLPRAVLRVQGDLLTAREPELAAFLDGADVLVHCAGEIRNPERMEALHVHATRRLVAAASRRVGRWVQLSSTGVYGPVREGTVTEASPQHPVGPYEVTKAASDALVLGAAADEAFEAVVLRPSIVFGADMSNDSLRQMARLVWRRRFAFVGHPGASANYVHVADVVTALVECAERAEATGAVYNLSGWTTMERFVGALAAGGGVPAPTARLPESLLRIAGRIGDRFTAMPVTTSRVDALTNRARYSTDRIETDLRVMAYMPLELSVEAVAATWAATR